MGIYVNSYDNNTMIVFGSGDIVVTTSNDLKEVIITPTIDIGEIGAEAKQYGGMSTDELPPGVRMAFDNPLSVQVVIDAFPMGE